MPRIGTFQELVKGQRAYLCSPNANLYIAGVVCRSNVDGANATCCPATQPAPATEQASTPTEVPAEPETALDAVPPLDDLAATAPTEQLAYVDSELLPSEQASGGLQPASGSIKSAADSDTQPTESQQSDCSSPVSSSATAPSSTACDEAVSSGLPAGATDNSTDDMKSDLAGSDDSEPGEHGQQEPPTENAAAAAAGCASTTGEVLPGSTVTLLLLSSEGSMQQDRL